MMFLGIDLGTSSVKVVLIDDWQTVVATTEQSLRVYRPQPLWSEQNPEEWWSATQKAIMELKSNFGPELQQVQSIGLSGQMHGATLLNDKGQALRPAILWNDGRSSHQCQTLLQRAPQAYAITGNMIFPGFTAPKLLWVSENEPDIFAQVKKVLLPKDYLRLQMTGCFATDLSDASGTSWLDIGARNWSLEMIEATGLSLQQMPQLFEGTEVTAQVLPEIAKQWGIPETTTVVAGGGDNAASAISMGVTEPGQAFLSLGTSGVYFLADNQYRPNPEAGLHTMCHCLPNRWHHMSVHLSAASCLDWVAQILGNTHISALFDLARQHHSENTPIFLPYLSGERTPINDSYAKGAFIGLTHSSGQAELAQSVLEGVSLAFAQGQKVIQDAGVNIDTVTVIGGGARSIYWGEILATALQRPLVYRKQGIIGGAFGAARLAWYSRNGGSFEHAFPTQEVEHVIKPITSHYPIFKKKQKIFDSLYPQLKNSFKLLNEETI